MRQVYVHCLKTSLNYPVKRNKQVAETSFCSEETTTVFLHPFKCLAHSKHLLNTLGIACRTFSQYYIFTVICA